MMPPVSTCTMRDHGSLGRLSSRDIVGYRTTVLDERGRLPDVEDPTTDDQTIDRRKTINAAYSSCPIFDARKVLPAVRIAMRLLELEQTNIPPLEELADRVGLSAGYLSRQFTAAFGESPAAYGRRIRLNHAATRLLFSPRSLSDIAGSFGFQNQPAFNRAFRRQHGASPRAFVKGLRISTSAEKPPTPPPTVHLTERPTEPALCRRFFGPDIGAHWRRFLHELSPALAKPDRRAGLIYDSPAVVSAQRQRYDCAIPIEDLEELQPMLASLEGLDVVALPGGSHAEIRGCEPDDIGQAIQHLYSIWLPNQTSFAPEGDPMVHWWGETAGVTVTIRLHRLLDVPAWNMVPLDGSGEPLGGA